LGSVVAVGLMGMFSGKAVAEGCKGCKLVDKTGEGFCCGKGRAFGVELTSKSLYEALVGHSFESSKITCSGCKTALKSNGKCEHCHVAAANGKFYKSPVAHALAKGKPVDVKHDADAGQGCPGCEKAIHENGRCDQCKVSFVAGRMFSSEDDYKAALAAHETLEHAAAAAKQCEACSVAMVTNGTCDHCKVKFEDGKMAKIDG